MPKDEFKEIKHLPDPMLREKDHYLLFCDAFKKKNSESNRPSHAKADKRRKPLLFSASVQHVKSIGVMLEWILWRLLCSQRKLSIKKKTELTPVAQHYKILIVPRSFHMCILEDISVRTQRKYVTLLVMSQFAFTALMTTILKTLTAMTFCLCSSCASSKEKIYKWKCLNFS